jgi:hypothetical protein
MILTATSVRRRTSIKLPGQECVDLYLHSYLRSHGGRAIAEVNRRASHRGGPGSVPVRSCGNFGGPSGTGAGLSPVLPFPLPIIPPTAPHSSSSIIRGWSNRPHRGRCTEWTEFHPTLTETKQEQICLYSHSFQPTQFIDLFKSAENLARLRNVLTNCQLHGVTFHNGLFNAFRSRSRM